MSLDTAEILNNIIDEIISNKYDGKNYNYEILIIMFSFLIRYYNKIQIYNQWQDCNFNVDLCDRLIIIC